jgi:hypothetical protein
MPIERISLQQPAAASAAAVYTKPAGFAGMSPFSYPEEFHLRTLVFIISECKSENIRPFDSFTE